MKFNIIENHTHDYNPEDVLKDYMQDELTVQQICDKYGISKAGWMTLIKKWKKRGIPLRGQGRFVKTTRRRIRVNDKTI